MFLRYNPVAGQTIRYRSEVDAWMRTPLLPTADTTLATMHISIWLSRTSQAPDSAGRIVFADYVDSSRYDMPAVRALAPQMASSGDLLRGLRAITSMDIRGRGVETRVISMPNMPQDVPVMVRGIQGLAVTTLRLAILSLPHLAVSPGDIWSDSVRYDQGTAAGMAQSLVTVGGSGLVTYKLERVEPRAGARIAVLTASARVNAGAQEPGQAASLAITASGQMDFNVDTGSLVMSQMDMAGPMLTRVGTIPVRIRVNMRTQ